MTNTIDLKYFGNINYYKILLNNSITNIYTNLPYKKELTCNRTTILGANGLINLTVPIVGGRGQKTSFGKVAIDYSQPWRQQHQRAIFTCYGKAPFFEYYKNHIEDIFSNKFTTLLELNKYTINKMILLLKQKEITLVFLKELPKIEVPNAIKNNNNEQLPYVQVFDTNNGFVPNLSILDLLFCQGPNSKNYL
jgi:WbqC-like protein family